MGADRSTVFETFKQLMGRFIDQYDSKDKFHLYAYNSPFDTQHLRELWKEHNDKYFGSWFYTPDICIMRMAAEVLIEDRNKMPNFKLETVVKHLGIKVQEGGDLHDAMIDIELTREIYLKLKEM